MHTGAAWADVYLLNLSSRGALAQAANPPPKGSYIEVRRGSYVIVARVVWRDKHRFGVSTQDRIPIDQIISAPDASKNLVRGQNPHQVERRATIRKPSSAQRHERSRTIAKRLEFCFLALAGLSMAAAAFSLAQDALATPLIRVTATLASK
jgi:hypothetical protein